MGVSVHTPTQAMTMRPIIAALLCVLAISVIEIGAEEHSLEVEDRQAGCCNRIRARCARACSGRSCSLTCTSYCGFWNTRCSYSCSSVSPSRTPPTQPTTTGAATTPAATTGDATTPAETTGDATTPAATTGDATTPAATTGGTTPPAPTS